MKIRSAEELLKFIAGYRKASGISASILATSANVSAKFLSQVENGKTSIEVDSLLKVTKALGLNISTLDEPEKLGKMLKKRREELDLDQITGAALCGVSPRFLSTIENGKPKKRLNKLFDVLVGFGIAIEIEGYE